MGGGDVEIRGLSQTQKLHINLAEPFRLKTAYDLTFPQAPVQA